MKRNLAILEVDSGTRRTRPHVSMERLGITGSKGSSEVRDVKIFSISREFSRLIGW